MIISRIYALTIGVLIFNIHHLQAIDINVNVNLDVFDKQDIVVYKEPITFTDCKFFRISGSSVYLTVDKNLKSHICNAGNVVFNVFAYRTDITSALINVQRETYTYDTMKSKLESISKQVIILSFETNYVSFVVCQTVFPECNLQSVDQQNRIANSSLKQYSACNGNNNLPCLTTVEFLPEIRLFNNSIASKIDLKPSNMASQYGVPVKCRNGGTISKTISSQRSLCDCPNASLNMKYGPQCEILQQKLVDPQYLYVLPNANTLKIEFLLSAASFQKTIQLLKINDKYGNLFMQYNIKEDLHTIEILNKSVNITKSLDTTNDWTTIVITITSDKYDFRVSEQLKTVPLGEIKAFPLQFDTLPLIIANNYVDKSSKICFSNLKVNGQMIDLNTPSFQDCQLNCFACKENETCISVPFKSSANAKCICSIGFGKLSETNSCSQNQAYQGQIDLNNSIMIPSQTLVFSSIQFKFRTLSDFGNLISFNLSVPKYSSLTIGINNRSLIVSLSNLNITLSIIINGYDVSNGEWHGILININNYMVEVFLDEDRSFNTEKLYFYNILTLESFTNLQSSSYQFGPMNSNRPTKSNLSTCYDSILLNPTSSSSTSNLTIQLSNFLVGGCSEGPSCESLQCNPADKRVCDTKWQNSSCICSVNFTDVNGVCLFTKCIPNPCQYNGVCTYVSSLDNYECKCANGYNGRNCENAIAAAGFPWWIILIIALLLLIILIVLIIFFVCCKRNREKGKASDIENVHENTVVYNDYAGEADYDGPPINFDMIQHGFKAKLPLSKAPSYPTADLQKRKLSIDKDNNDLVLDQALDYGYEGSISDRNSISSLGSGSTNEPLDIETLQRSDGNFNYLKNLYK